MTVPSLPGCISEGDTFEEAERNIREAIELYTEVMGSSVKLNRSEGKTFSAPILVKI